MALTGSGTQSHPDYVMLGRASRGTKVVVFVRKDLVDGVSIIPATARVVVVEVVAIRWEVCMGSVGWGYMRWGIGWAPWGMDRWRRLSALGRLECPSRHLVTRWEVGTWGQGVGGVGPRARRGDPLRRRGDIRAEAEE